MIIEKEKYEFFIDIDSSELFENMTFNRCTFEYCNLSRTENPEYRTRIRNIELINCIATGCSIGCAEIENVTIKNLKTNGMTQIYGAVFKNVKLEGKFGKMIVNNYMYSDDEDKNNAFAEANDQFYDNVEMALDISEADFIELNIRGIASDKIIRNPEFQAVIRRENIPEDWEKIAFNNSITETVLGGILFRGSDDYIYMAGTRSKYREDILRDIALLRKLGIADDD